MDTQANDPKTQEVMQVIRLVAKRSLLVLALFFLPTSAVFAEPVEITFMHAFHHVGTETQQQIVDDFNRSHPHIRVTIEQVPWNQALEIVQVRTAGGVSPDIVSASPSDFFGFADQQGLFLDLSSWVERHWDHFSDIPAPVWEEVTIRGSIFAIPQRLSTQVLFYNLDHFEEAGLARPPHDWFDPSWNWDQFRTYAQRLTVDRNGNGTPDVFGLQNYVPTRFRTFLYATNGHVVTEDYSDFSLDHPDAFEAVRFTHDLTVSGYIGGNYMNETASMFVVPPTQLGAMQNASFNWEVAPMPQGPGGPGTTLGPIAVGVLRASQNQEAALEFLRYYRGREASALETQNGIVVQPFFSVTGDLRNYPAGTTQGQVDVFAQALQVGRAHRDNHPNASAINSLVNSALTAIIRLEKDPAVALAEIRPQVVSLLRGN